ncbi:hypothetical protein IFR05_016186 [Cadophora sp. M221]|nr:hypothetical protein IFR05_016186 [Cadophora sp. M221]
MPNKPIKKGYKIYGIADHGYIYNWVWSSIGVGLQALFKHPKLTATGSLVRSLVLSLPRKGLSVYLDNYFTSIPLFEELRACGYGAVGTTRPHAQLPSNVTHLKKRFATSLPWNTLCAKVVENTLCLAWQDMFTPPKGVRNRSVLPQAYFRRTSAQAVPCVPTLKYAILSHRWEAEETTFEDLQNGTGMKKAGYEKIRFCGE